MRVRSLAFLLPLAAAVSASAGTVHLKVQAETPAGQPVKVTLKALSRVPVSLSAQPVVYVDEGQGFKARPDLQCRIANTDHALKLEADREFTGSCELALPPAPKVRVRLAYRQGETVSTSNAVTLQVTGPATAQATK